MKQIFKRCIYTISTLADIQSEISGCWEEYLLNFEIGKINHQGLHKTNTKIRRLK